MSRKIRRCEWVSKDPIYIKYHDEEWGVPAYNDNEMFEHLFLETFQSGLSWITILKKRENFRKAFDNFNYNKIANYSDKKLTELINDRTIIRNKLKIKASTINAKSFIQIQQEFGSFNKYLWKFIDNYPIKNSFKNINELPKKTKLSEMISLDLKKKGFQFIGSTMIYAYMQAIGMVNDHTIDCYRYNQI